MRLMLVEVQAAENSTTTAQTLAANNLSDSVGNVSN
jgi:hypothetical protein